MLSKTDFEMESGIMDIHSSFANSHVLKFDRK